jgi:hypothetical protein
MVAGMDEDAVRIVPIEDGVRIVPVEGVHDSSGRARPPWWVVVVMVVSTIGLVWMFNQGSQPEPEPEPVEFRTVYSVPGWEHSFESIKEFLPQPQSAFGYTWSLVALLHGEFNAIGADSEIGMVIGGGPGLLAVGSSSSSAAVWSSVDGATWSRVAHDETVFGGDGLVAMHDVTVGGPGLVAVGGERLISVDPSGVPIDDDWDDDWDEDAAVWTSVDGSVWTRIPHNEDVFGSARLWTVVAGGPGLVAVGDDLQQDAVGERGSVGVWVSNDGLSWSRVPLDDSVFARATVESVVAGGPGLVAVGHTGTDDDYEEGPPSDDWDAAVWVSPDGMSWSRVAHDEAVFGGDGPVAMYDVTVGGPGLVADGGRNQGAVGWTSQDGLEWVRVPHDESISGSRAILPWITDAMFSVASGGDDLVAVDEDDDQLWASNDGLTWRRITGGGWPFDGGSRVIAVGPDYFLFNEGQVWAGIPNEQ